MDLLKPSYATGYAKNASQSAHPNLWDGLVGAWMPSLGVTGETLRDVSGNGNHGYFYFSEVTDWRTDSLGHSIEFDGSDSIQTGFNQSLGDFTATAWFKSSHSRNTQRIVDKNYLNGFWMGQAYPASVTTYGGGIRQTSAPYGLYLNGFATDKWHMLTMQRRGGTQLLWGNGTSMFATQSCSSSPLSTDVLLIGNGGGQPFTGNIGNISIYNRALSPSEIKQLYVDSLAPFRTKKRTVVRVPAAIPAATKVGSIKKPTTIIKPSYQAGYARNASESENPKLWDGLVGAWMPSLGVTGETLRDVSGNGNHGTLTNMDAASDWVTTSKGLALDYDGVNEMVDVDSPPVIDGSSATYSLWVRANSVYSWMSPCGYVTAGFDDYRFIFRRTNTGLIQTYVRRSNSINFSAATPSGFSWYDWNHFLIVADGSLSQTYVNGSFLASNNSGSGNLNFGTTFTLGNQDLRSGGSTWNGGITNVKLYNRALSPSEIKQLYVDSLAPFRRKQRVSVAVPAATPTPSATYHPLRSLAHPLEQ